MKKVNNLYFSIKLSLSRINGALRQIYTGLAGPWLIRAIVLFVRVHLDEKETRGSVHAPG